MTTQQNTCGTRIEWTVPKAACLILFCVLCLGTVIVNNPQWFSAALEVAVDEPGMLRADEGAWFDVEVRSRMTGRPVRGARVALVFWPGTRKSQAAGEALTGKSGRCRLRVTPEHAYSLPYATYTVHVTRAVMRAQCGGRVWFRDRPGIHAGERPSGIRIVADRPVYQPGQTVHYSAFVLTPEKLEPLAGAEANVDIRDPSGNCIYSMEGKTSAHANVNGKLELGTGIQPGVYTIRVRCGEDVARRQVTVKRYVPRRIRIETVLAPDPVVVGETVRADVHARYLSGQPVGGASCRLLLQRGDRVLHEHSGRLDDKGVARAHLEIDPNALEADDTWQTVDVSVTVEDGGTPETWEGHLTVCSPEPLTALLPDGGTLIPGCENRIALAAYRADGAAAPGRYTVHVQGRTHTVHVGKSGVAWFTLVAAAGDLTAEIAGPGVPPHEVVFGSIDANRLRVSLPARCAVPGGELPVSVSIREDVRAELADLRLALVAGIEECASETFRGCNDDGTVACRFRLPDTVNRTLTVEAVLTTLDGTVFSAEAPVPIATKPFAEFALTAKPGVTRPGDKMALAIEPTRTDAATSGVATVVVTDAAVLERAGGQTIEAETGAWLRQHSASGHPDLPRVVLNALDDAGGLPFLPLLYRATGRNVTNNKPRLRMADRQRQARWWRLWGAGAIAFLAACLAYGFGCVLAENGGCLIWLVVAALCVTLAGMLMPALSQAREKSLAVASLSMSTDDMKTAIANARRGADSGSDSGPTPGILVPATARRTAARKDFPETLLFLPEVPLDDAGRATVDIELSDNVTTWHASAVGLTGTRGLLAGGTEILATKPFFLEADFPVAFIVGDAPVVRLMAFNNGPAAEAAIELVPSDFLDCPEPKRLVRIEENGAAQVRFAVRFTTSGKHTLEIRARCGSHEDALALPVEVTRHGREVFHSVHGRLRDGEAETCKIGLPDDLATPRCELFVRSNVGDECLAGLAGMLRTPHGCFEQTSSVNYPNVLILKYLKSIGEAKSPDGMKARKLLEVGCQRLLGFEVDGGGFSLYGHKPASVWLSAYGLMQLVDMREFVHVDPEAIDRTWSYLQRNLPKTDPRSLAYTLWAARKAGYRPETDARGKLADMFADSGDAYARALAANAMLALDLMGPRDRERLHELAEDALRGAPSVRSVRSLTSARGKGARVELLALITFALERANVRGATKGKLLDRILEMRHPNGDWPGTHATVLALHAIVAASPGGAGTITVEKPSGGKQVLTAGGNKPCDVLALGPETGDYTMSFDGEGSISYSLVARGLRRWGAEADTVARRGLNLTVSIPDEATTGDGVPVQVKLANWSDTAADNCLVEIGCGPALRPHEMTLAKLVRSAALNRFDVLDGKAVLYLDRLAPHDEVSLTFHAIATREGAYRLPPSRAYEYYCPENSDCIPGRRIAIGGASRSEEPAR